VANEYAIQLVTGRSSFAAADSSARCGLIARGRKDATKLWSRTSQPTTSVRVIDFDHLLLDFAKADIEAGNTSDAMQVLVQLLEKDAAMKFCERLDVCSSEYESDQRELWEIPEVRAFVQKLDREFPYWCYFLSKLGDGLLWMTYCLYPLAVTQDERKRLWPQAIRKYADGRGIPHLTAFCRFVGSSDEEAVRLTKNAVDYLVFKPLGKHTNEQVHTSSATRLSDRFPRAAERTETDAQFYMGSLYYAGHNAPNDYVIPPDCGLARFWLQKAAEKDHAGAEYLLGVLCHHGQGIARDQQEAVAWYWKAADHGHAEAQYTLGNAYYYGAGATRDYLNAANWYQRAADQGQSEAQYALGVLHDSGQGVPQDVSRAVYWYRKAAEQGKVEAQYNLGFKYDKGEGVGEDHRQAAAWYKRAADQGSADAQFGLAGLYYFGHGVPQNSQEAYFWLSLATAGAAADRKEGFGQFRDGIASELSTKQRSESEGRMRDWLAAHSVNQR
jgi:TPR repeat protein